MAKTVALLVGGWSAERQVSLDKGKEVEQALLLAGYDPKVIDVKKDLPALLTALDPKPDVVFNNLYGRGGEDGVIQGVLEMLGIPYTHSGVLASALAMDKAMTKYMARAAGIPTAKWEVGLAGELMVNPPLSPPYVVKPVNEGSSVGVYIIRHDGPVEPAELDHPDPRQELMVEQYVPGRELTVAVLDGAPQNVTEIISHTEFFDYSAKYQDNTTEYALPADIPENVYNKALDYAALIFKMEGCRGLARCDFRYNDGPEGPSGLSFLEINTQPGLTAQSIGPSQVIHNGTSFPQLCAHLVETAQCQTDEINNPDYSLSQASPADSEVPLHAGLKKSKRTGS